MSAARWASTPQRPPIVPVAPPGRPARLGPRVRPRGRGILGFWGFGLLAEGRLRSHGPELLNTMRTGRSSTTAVKARFRFEELSVPRKALAWWCLGLGAIPLIPQGIIAAIFVSNGTLRHTWFLATYMSPELRYPVAGAFIALGVLMYGAGLWIVKPQNRPARS